MGRYSNTALTKPAGFRVYKSTLLPAIPRSPQDTYVISSVGDRLDLLAHKYYGNVAHWWVIAEANGLGKGTLEIPAGTQVRIPTNLNSIILEFENLNKA